MSTDRDTTRIVRSWLEEGATALPDRVLDAVLDQVPTTSQRRPWWPARRFREMNMSLKLAIAAAAVVVVALVGIALLPRDGGFVAGPGPSPAPTPTQTPAPTPSGNVDVTGSLAPATTYTITDPCCVASRMTFTMPATGWYAPLEPWRIGKNVTGGSDLFDLIVTPHFVDNVYTGGCHWHGTALVPRIGPSVDDLAIALAQAGRSASPPIAVTVGGHAGKKVELSIPPGLDISTCDSDGDSPIFGRWYTDVPDSTFGAQPYTHDNGQHDTIYIIDVDGTRQVIDAMYLPNASAADRAEQDQIIASIRFESPAPSPLAPSPSP